MILPLQNIYNFLEMYAKADGWQNRYPKIWIMRHAQAEGTHKDAEILPEEQNRLEDPALQEQLLAIRPDVVIFSPWKRTAQTAELIKQKFLEW